MKRKLVVAHHNNSDCLSALSSRRFHPRLFIPSEQLSSSVPPSSFDDVIVTLLCPLTSAIIRRSPVRGSLLFDRITCAACLGEKHKPGYFSALIDPALLLRLSRHDRISRADWY